MGSNPSLLMAQYSFYNVVWLQVFSFPFDISQNSSQRSLSLLLDCLFTVQTTFIRTLLI